MRMLIYRLIYYFIRIANRIENHFVLENRKVFLKKGCTFDTSVSIYEDARVQNHQNNPQQIRIGNNTQVRGHLMVFGHGGEIQIGDHCYIGELTRIWSAKKITIGNRVLIAHNVNIHDNNSHPIDATLRHEDFKKIFSSGFQKKNDLNEKDVVIGDDAWIGFNSTILKGVQIGNGAIIAACSLVTKDVEPFTLVAGNPAVFIKRLDSTDRNDS
ncbi:MAG: acyltransferase [Bacteroidetes bacterium]|nr:acyltransferase [Bacteroidota bacterium]